MSKSPSSVAPSRSKERAFLFLLVLAVSAAPAFGQAGVLKPNAEERSVGEIRVEPRPGNFADSLAAVAAHLAPSGPDVEGTARMPRRTFAQSTALASRQFGYESVQLVDQATQAVLNAFRPERIIDNDWKRVTNTKAIPYRAVCYIESSWPDGRETIGTAFFVGKRVLLTNAHNLYDRRKKHWATTVRVYPGRDGNDSPYGSEINSDLYIPTDYISSNINTQWDYDIGWIILPSKSLFNKIGFSFGFQTTTDANLEEMNLNSAGYPGAKNQQQWRDFETKNQNVFKMQFEHFHDILGGSSGSPMYVFEKKERFAVGVNAWEDLGSRRVNGATRITKDYYDWTKQFRSQYP